MEKVLVMLSTFNGEKYLPELLTSLLNQKNVDLHIKIRDDGSNDNTIKYLESVANSKVDYYIGKNKKAVGSFLELIQIAPLDYDYYAFCDQDDVWLEDKMESAVVRLNGFDKGKPALYYSGQIITDDKLNILCEHNLDLNRSVKANCIFNQMAGCTAVINKSLLEKLKKYTPANIYGHDVWCYKVCAALGGNIVIESKGHILYRQHDNNVVGLKNGIKGKINRANAYINKYNASSYAGEILSAYKDELDDDWTDYLQTICDSKKTFSSKVKLLLNNEIKFNSVTLRMIFLIKVLLGKV